MLPLASQHQWMWCAGIEAIVDAMEAWSDQEGVQCNGCLALMSLVRGVGEACQVRLPLHTCMCSNAL